MNKLSYSIGALVAQTMINELKIRKVDEYNDFLQAIKDVYSHNVCMSADEINEELSNYLNSLNNEAKEAGIKFLEENAKRPEVTVLPSGLQYEVIKEGDGDKPSATDKVTVHYEGSLIDGTIFDSSYKRGETISFGLNQVIKGWTEGLQLMSVGSKYKLYIPYDLGYGTAGAGDSIPPCATLIFTVELFGIEK